MAPRTLNREQCGQIDRRAVDEFGMSSLVLMENAGRGVVDVLCRLGTVGGVVVCCGKGNNGGDGLVIARHLDIRGVAVRVLLFAGPAELTGDAAANYGILSKSSVAIQTLPDAPSERDFTLAAAGAEWLVDALLGTGARGEPRPPLDQVIGWMNRHPARRLAVDVPSGLDCDTGQAAAATIRAEHTCTFLAAKPGFFAAGADEYTGQLHVLDIGAPRALVEQYPRGG